MTRLQKNLSLLVIIATAMGMMAARHAEPVVLIDGKPAVVESVSPISAPGLNLLIVAETDNDIMAGYSESQQDIIGSLDWQADWINRGGQIRFIDPSDEHPGDDPKWREPFDKLKAAGLEMPRAAIGNGTTGEMLTLPRSENGVTEWKALIAKYLGGQP